jgi:A/G-specific adenine glycosylase
MGEAKHIFSHVEWHMLGYHIRLNKDAGEFLKENSYVWADRNEVKYKYALPNAFSAFTAGIK